VYELSERARIPRQRVLLLKVLPHKQTTRPRYYDAFILLRNGTLGNSRHADAALHAFSFMEARPEYACAEMTHSRTLFDSTIIMSHPPPVFYNNGFIDPCPPILSAALAKHIFSSCPPRTYAPYHKHAGSRRRLLFRCAVPTICGMFILTPLTEGLRNQDHIQ